MGTDLPERKPVSLQLLDQEWPRDAEQIGGLLPRQLGVYRDEGHCVALGHLGQELHQELDCRGREHDGLVGILDADAKDPLRVPHQLAAGVPGERVSTRGTGIRIVSAIQAYLDVR